MATIRAFLVYPDDDEWSVFWSATSAGKAKHAAIKEYHQAADEEIGEMYRWYKARRLPECDYLATAPGELDRQECLDAMGAVVDEDGRWHVP